MKVHPLGLFLMIAALLVTGCATLRPDSNLTVATIGVPNPPSPDALVYLSANRVDDHTYEIIAQGDASLRAEQFERTWIWMADKLARRPGLRKADEGGFIRVLRSGGGHKVIDPPIRHESDRTNDAQVTRLKRP